MAFFDSPDAEGLNTPRFCDSAVAGILLSSVSQAAFLSHDSWLPVRLSNADFEGEMDRIQGTVREILLKSDGGICGFVIDGGLEVHFSMNRANQIAAIVSLGSRLELCGHPYQGVSGDPRLDAVFVKNLDSRCSVNLRNSPQKCSPEMPPTCSPTPPQAASLAPPETRRWSSKNRAFARTNSLSQVARHPAFGESETSRKSRFLDRRVSLN